MKVLLIQNIQNPKVLRTLLNNRFHNLFSPTTVFIEYDVNVFLLHFSELSSHEENK